VSNLITDTGGTKDRTGNRIILIHSTNSGNFTNTHVSITPRYTGCYSHVYTNNWTTGKHIMWGGHESYHKSSSKYSCYVDHYICTPIV